MPSYPSHLGHNTLSTGRLKYTSNYFWRQTAIPIYRLVNINIDMHSIRTHTSHSLLYKYTEGVSGRVCSISRRWFRSFELHKWTVTFLGSLDKPRCIPFAVAGALLRKFSRVLSHRGSQIVPTPNQEQSHRQGEGALRKCWKGLEVYRGERERWGMRCGVPTRYRVGGVSAVS